MNILELYDLAAENNIQIDHRRLNTMKLSIPGNIILTCRSFKPLQKRKFVYRTSLGTNLKMPFTTSATRLKRANGRRNGQTAGLYIICCLSLT